MYFVFYYYEFCAVVRSSGLYTVMAYLDSSWKIDVWSLSHSWCLVGSVHIQSTSATYYVFHNLGEHFHNTYLCLVTVLITE